MDSQNDTADGSRACGLLCCIAYGEPSTDYETIKYTPGLYWCRGVVPYPHPHRETGDRSMSNPVQPVVMPCPFCGGKAELEFKCGDWGYTPNTVSIGCEPCGIMFIEKAQEWKQGVGTYSIREQAETKVLQRWNTRSV